MACCGARGRTWRRRSGETWWRVSRDDGKASQIFFSRILEEVEQHFRSVGETSGQGAIAATQEEEEAEAYDFIPYVFPLYGETGWADEQQVNSGQRARALALKLEERGYLCDFTEAELVVSLPLRLKGEYFEGGVEGEEDEEGMEGMFDQEEEGFEVANR